MRWRMPGKPSLHQPSMAGAGAWGGQGDGGKKDGGERAAKEGVPSVGSIWLLGFASAILLPQIKAAS